MKKLTPKTFLSCKKPKGAALGIARLLVLAFTVAWLGDTACSYAEGYVYESKGKRDPFVPLVGIGAPPISSLDDVLSIDDITLQGIACDAKGERAAILNGEIVKEGQTKGRVTVEKITDRVVTVGIEGEKHDMSIFEHKID